MNGLFRRLRYHAWFQSNRAKYHMFVRWTGGNLLEGPIGEHVKIRFSDPSGGGESMWAERVTRDTYRMLNNGFFTPVAQGDIVRVKIEWPYLVPTETVHSTHRTVRIAFDLPWPSLEHRKRIGEAVDALGGDLEWGYADLLTISLGRAIDPHQALGSILGANARILDFDD